MITFRALHDSRESRTYVDNYADSGWGGGENLFVHSLKGGIKGPINIETKNVARKSNTPTSLDGVSLMAGKFSVRHCFTLILPKYDESVVFVNIIENCMRVFSFSLHPHILKQ